MPYEVRVGVVLTTLLVAIFAAVVVPLLAGGGDTRAEIAGKLPTTAVAGHTLTLEIGIDNVGGSDVNPICVVASADPPVDLVELRVQGLDRLPFHGDRACGGRLTGQETVSAVLLLVPRQPGPLHLSITAAKGDTVIGPPLQGSIDVTAG